MLLFFKIIFLYHDTHTYLAQNTYLLQYLCILVVMENVMTPQKKSKDTIKTPIYQPTRSEVVQILKQSISSNIKIIEPSGISSHELFDLTVGGEFHQRRTEQQLDLVTRATSKRKATKKEQKELLERMMKDQSLTACLTLSPEVYTMSIWFTSLTTPQTTPFT